MRNTSLILSTTVPGGLLGWVFEFSDRTVEDVVMVSGDAAIDEIFFDENTIGLRFGTIPLSSLQTKSAVFSVTYGPLP